jgi:hypothetical protein
MKGNKKSGSTHPLVPYLFYWKYLSVPLRTDAILNSDTGHLLTVFTWSHACLALKK